jgi:long-chain acyl-CoA synthetase
MAFRNAPPTLRTLFEAGRSNREFLVFGDERLTFEDAWLRAAKIGRVLVEECGVAKGDRVAISMRNCPEWVLAFMATASVGAVAVAMNAHWQSPEMQYALTDSRAGVVFVDSERLDRLTHCEHLPAGLQVLGVRLGAPPLPLGAKRLRDLLATVKSNEMPVVEMHPDDDVVILYTSGSSGSPKGAVSSHRNLTNALLSFELDDIVGGMATTMTVEASERHPSALLALPLFHVGGLHAVVLSAMRRQWRVVAMPRWDVEQAAALIERERVATFVGPSAITGDLVHHAGTTKRDLSSLATVGGGGAARAPEQVRGIARMFPNAVPHNSWALTETNAVGTVIGGQDYLRRPHSCGQCSALLEMRIVDKHGNNLPAGERGEVLVRGVTVVRGYWNRPEADAETFTDAWLRTGDVAYLDEDGYLFIVDRIKDLVIRGGENIGCGSVEAAILEHPAVREASVYGVPDDRLGEEVATTVYATEGLDEVTLRRFLEARLARFEVPRHIFFSSVPLPRTASGKTLKRELRRIAVARLDDPTIATTES